MSSLFFRGSIAPREKQSGEGCTVISRNWLAAGNSRNDLTERGGGGPSPRFQNCSNGFLISRLTSGKVRFGRNPTCYDCGTDNLETLFVIPDHCKFRLVSLCRYQFRHTAETRRAHIFASRRPLSQLSLLIRRNTRKSAGVSERARRNRANIHVAEVPLLTDPDSRHSLAIS